MSLSNITVLDLTHYFAGPYCTKLMAGFGANVIKVERPGSGDKLRTLGPFFTENHSIENSIPFQWLNTGKKSITLDLRSEEGTQIIKKLVAQADVLIESFRPRTMPGFGLSYLTLQTINPRLIMTAISNFGQSGPYRDYEAEEIVEYALSGLMSVTGDPNAAPLCSGPLMTQYTAGMHAYIASLMALLQRDRTGQGQFIDVSIHESALGNIEISLAEFLHLGRVAKRSGDKHPLVPWQLYPCKDGHAAVIGGPVRHWLPAVPMFDEPRLFDEKYRHMSGRMQHREEVDDLLKPWLSKHRKREIYYEGQRRHLAFGYLATLAEVEESPQLNSRGYFVDVEHPVSGKQKHCGPAFRMSAIDYKTIRAPLLGEHTEEILCGYLGYSRERLEALSHAGVISLPRVSKA